jgi:outer membrane protein assembly factor BamB
MPIWLGLSLSTSYQAPLLPGDTPCDTDGLAVFCRDTQVAYFTRSAAQEIVELDLRNRKSGWNLAVPDSIYSNLVATKSVVVFSCGLDNICAVSRSTGKEVWKVRERSRQLAVVGQRVIAQSVGRDDLVALDSESGRILWRHRARRGQGPYAGVLAVSQSSILTTDFGLSVATGEVSVRLPTANGAAISAAVFSDKLTVIIQQMRMKAYYENSQQAAWDVQLPLQGFEQPKVIYLRASTSGPIATIAETAVSRTRGLLRIVQVGADGAVRWTKDVSDIDVMFFGPHGPASVADGHFVIVTREPESLASGMSTIRAFDIASGRLEWMTPLRARLSSRSLVTFDAGTAYFMVDIDTGLGAVMKLDLENGRVEPVMKLSH